jgi:hypothetical protein
MRTGGVIDVTHKLRASVKISWTLSEAVGVLAGRRSSRSYSQELLSQVLVCLAKIDPFVL